MATAPNASPTSAELWTVIKKEMTGIHLLWETVNGLYFQPQGKEWKALQADAPLLIHLTQTALMESLLMRVSRLLDPAATGKMTNLSLKQLVVAEFPDSTANNRIFAGQPGSITGVNMRLPKPGDRLVIYGVGFGPTNPAQAAGRLVGQANSVPGIQILINNAPATIEYAGLAPSAIGLYQFNIIVPNVQAGENPITMSVSGLTTQSNVFLITGN